MEEITEEMFDELVADGFMEVVGVRNGEKFYRLTETGQVRARQVMIGQGVDPDDLEQVEGLIRSWF